MGEPPTIEPGSADFWYQVLAAASLVTFGGLMSGLTLGLLSVEELDLGVIERSGDEVERQQAAKVKGLIHNQHLLLVTLLLCNAAAMEALPLILDDLVSPLAAVAISVTAVLAFGEILPQAVCKTYGLAVGAATAPIVRVLLVICSPIAWPIAKLLDWVLGHDGGTIYRRPQIAAILEIHKDKGQLTHAEAMVMQGALDLAKKRCSACMTPTDRVKSLGLDEVMDEENVEWILQTGHSRIPVRGSGGSGFVGVLLVKTLIKIHHADGIPVRDLPHATMLNVSEATLLYELLDIFQTGQSHMAAIYPENTEIDDIVTAPVGEPIGIITLEDLIEELIAEEIVDETDRFVHADTDTGSAKEWRCGLKDIMPPTKPPKRMRSKASKLGQLCKAASTLDGDGLTRIPSGGSGLTVSNTTSERTHRGGSGCSRDSWTLQRPLLS